MTYVKFVDGKDNDITDVNTNIIPVVGNYVLFTSGKMARVTRVTNVYGRAGDWVEVTVEPVQS